MPKLFSMFFPLALLLSEKLATPKSRNICQVGGEDIRIQRLLDIEIAKKRYAYNFPLRKGNYSFN